MKTEMQYSFIRNLSTIRTIAKLLPLKRKLDFLIKRYLKTGNKLSIPFSDNWDINITVTNNNQSTVSNLILEGSHSQPEGMLLKRLKKELPDQMTLIDVGGNIGSFFCQFINKCESIYVFEPIPRLYSVIRESVKHNNRSNVHLITKAVGDAAGQVQMLDNNNSNVLTDSATNEEIINIEVTTLDVELAALKKIDFIKIDVEGYELHVLQGAQEIISKHKPALLIEVHPGFLKNYHKSHSDIIDILQKLNYSIEYFSFLAEERMSKAKRILQRWNGSKGIAFKSKQAFLADVETEPRLMSYHLYCKPLSNIL